MATCRDCIHNKPCNKIRNREFYDEDGAEILCADFKDKSGFLEAKKGKWVYHECVASFEGAISGYSCSVCSSFVDEEVFDTDKFHKDFCGHCGAKMSETDTNVGGKCGFNNYENIKNNMSVEQLAELLYTIADDICFKNCARDTGNKYSCKIGEETKPENCINCMKVWLESESKE